MWKLLRTNADLRWLFIALVISYIGDFDLGTTARNIDVFGASGVGLQAQPGYISIDNKMFRIADITVPVIVKVCPGAISNV